MEPFRTVQSIVTPLPEPNIDTDQIIPKQFLKLVTRSGFGRYLFYDRMKSTAFVLNDSRYRGSRILVAGDNFGCGSSREHAVWALKDYGFDVIISTSFAEIFYSNCIKNGVLPIRLDDTNDMMDERGPVTVNLEKQVITLPARTIPFRIDPYKRTILLEGLDEIAQTMKYESVIENYERNDRSWNV